MSSASLADFKGNPADIPDGNEIINADDEEEVYSNDEKDDVANALDVSSDDDSAPTANTSDSDSDNRSNKKPPAKREDDKKPPAKSEDERNILLPTKRVVEANIHPASKRQKLKPPASTAASAVQSSSAAQ
eukprot:scaffold59912_cov28-Attheya_sp.AAC.1